MFLHNGYKTLVYKFEFLNMFDLLIKKIIDLGLFDADFYLRNYPVNLDDFYETHEHGTVSANFCEIKGDAKEEEQNLLNIHQQIVRDKKLVALKHYLEYGWKQGFDPSEKFSTSCYLSTYADVKAAGCNPLIHYVEYGIDENRLILKHMNFPKFSLIMPTYNRKAFISNSIRSVLNQLSEHNIEFELIIADDGSTDGTVDMIRVNYKNELNQKKIVLVTAEHSGVSAARNKAVSVARYDWLCYIDDDNSLLPGYLDTFYKNIIKNPFCQFFYAQHYLGTSQKVVEHEFNRQQLLEENYIDLGTVCHTKIVFKRVGGFDESLTRLVDWDLIIRMTSIAEPVYIPEIVMNYSSDASYARITNSVQPLHNCVAIANKNLVEKKLYDAVEKTNRKQEELFKQYDESLHNQNKQFEEKFKQQNELLHNQNKQLEEQFKRLCELKELLHNQGILQDGMLKQINEMKELSLSVNNALISKFVILKFKILKSVTFGSYHNKYKRIYKILKQIKKQPESK